jgi:predicted short-subunit dehydrogenase-like oxidoreductase (DUF2520 family)
MADQGERIGTGLRKTLNIVGCGNVGKVLGRLWTESGTFAVQHVLNRSIESARHAVDFMGAGVPVGAFADLHAADVWLIGTPDDHIAAACRQLAHHGLLQNGNIAFHCSGALPSAVLQSALPHGVAVASIHPIRSFAEPMQATNEFAGTFCGAEGDQAALDILNPAFVEIGAHLVAINAEFKDVYHSAAVFASNYVVTLLDVALSAYETAGVPRETALRLMEPLVRGTVDNVFRLGPTNALTGPAARGDTATVNRQYHAVRNWDECYGNLYEQLAKLVKNIAVRKFARKY